MEDNSRQVRYICDKCGKRIGKWLTHDDHFKQCLSKFQLDIDYIKCALCEFTCRNIACHVRKQHNMTRDEYRTKFGNTLASSTRKTYSDRNKANGNWIARANESGVDLTEYKKKMSKAVSEAILANPEECNRRAKLWAATNRTDAVRKKSSDTAKITSRRKDVLENRTERLRNWRNTHHDEFYDKCVSKMIGYRQSKPEKMLLEFVQQIAETFMGNQRISSNDLIKTTKTHRRQIDILSKEHKIAIEFDGILHFKNIKQWNQLKNVRLKDKELNKALPKMGYALIRVGYDQFSSPKNKFDELCLERLKELIQCNIDSHVPGLYLIGEVYDVAKNKLEMVTI